MLNNLSLYYYLKRRDSKVCNSQFLCYSIKLAIMKFFTFTLLSTPFLVLSSLASTSDICQTTLDLIAADKQKALDSIPFKTLDDECLSKVLKQYLPSDLYFNASDTKFETFIKELSDKAFIVRTQLVKLLNRSKNLMGFYQEVNAAQNAKRIKVLRGEVSSTCADKFIKEEKGKGERGPREAKDAIDLLISQLDELEPGCLAFALKELFFDYKAVERGTERKENERKYDGVVSEIAKNADLKKKFENALKKYPNLNGVMERAKQLQTDIANEYAKRIEENEKKKIIKVIPSTSIYGEHHKD